MIITLLSADIAALRRWFSQGNTGRIAVIVLFFLLAAGIASGLYAISFRFFRMLAGFEMFGTVTADYIIHASVVLLVWLSILASCASSAGLLSVSTVTRRYLLSLPVPPHVLAEWILVKSVIANIMLLCMTMLPVCIGYAQAMGVFDWTFIFRTILMLAVIVCISTGIGLPVAMRIRPSIQGKEYIASIVLLTVFFCGMILLLKTIFPSSLPKLYDTTTTDQFWSLYEALPLNNPYILTGWIARTITDTLSVASAAVLSLALLIVYCAVLLSGRMIFRAYARMDAASGGFETSFRRVDFTVSNNPLFTKDVLSISRVPSEGGYGIFLLSIATFFFGALSFARTGRQLSYQEVLIAFAYAWLIFFATAFALRFIFPLMAREGKHTWFLFTLPVAKESILAAKVRFSMVAALAFSVFASVVWIFLPFASGYRLLMIACSIGTILFLFVLYVFLGSIYPDFSSGEEPEKISTSGMGLLALSIGIICAAGGASIIRMIVLTGELISPRVLILDIFCVLLLLVASILARKMRYNL